MSSPRLHELGPLSGSDRVPASLHETGHATRFVRPGAGRRRPGERGATIIEFALVLPVIFILILSVMDFGLCFFAQHTLQFATREGVRVALVGRIMNDANGNPMTREATIIKTIQDKAGIAIPADKLHISIYQVPPDMSDPKDWAGTQDAGVGGSYMRVRTSFDYHFMTPMLGAIFKSGMLSLQAQATYRNEQF